jgi:hypothetical protein
MKKLVLFTEEDLITDIFEVDQLIIKGNDLNWIGGGMHSIRIQYAVLPYEVQLNKGDKITQDIKEQDQSADHLMSTEERQAADMQLMINQMLLDPTDFNQDQQINHTQTMLNNFMLGGLM